jgi:LmbE family N-acetylglucosaminyl deacetylase
MATVNRDYLIGLLDTAEGRTWLAAEEEEGPPIDNLGVPEERITTAVDVTAFLDRKRRAMEAHASQISETSFFLSMPPEAFAAVWGHEWYIRVGADVVRPFEGSLLPDDTL